MTPSSALFSWLRARWLKFRGVRFSGPARIASGAKIRRGVRNGAQGQVEIGPGCELDCGAVLDAWGGAIALGHNIFIGPYAVIYGHGGVSVGDGTLISMHCRILSSNHAVPPAGTAIRSQPDVLLPTRIGRDVWLGAGVTVLGGVTIGEGCVVGAGAVVTKDLPPGAIAFGVPAVIARSRGGSTNP